MTGLFGGYDPAAILEARAQQTSKEAIAAGQGGGMYAPMLSAAYRMGDLAGAGIGRLFGMEDPVLAKATKAQEAANEVAAMDINQNDPQAVYGAMVKAFQARGLTDLAMPLMKELQGFKKAEQDLKAGALGIDKTQLEIYKAAPERMNEAIAAETDPAKRDALVKTQQMFARDRDLNQQKALADIALTQAKTTEAKSHAAALGHQVAAGKLTAHSVPNGYGGATIVYSDPKTGQKISEIPVGPQVNLGLGNPTNPANPVNPANRPSLNSFNLSGQ